MTGMTYIGNDPGAIPSTSGKESNSLHVVGGKLAWTGFKLNPSVISENLTIVSGVNAMLTGPVAIEDGFTIIIEDGAVLTVI